MQRILIVDDDLTNRKLLLALLKSSYDVIEAVDGPQALERCTRDQPSLVLLDINMPGMSGHEVAVSLKQDAATRHIPIIMLTALDDRATIAQAHENGACDYVVKPFDAVELLTKIKRAMN